MQTALMTYFDGEKHGGLFLAGCGLVGLVAALMLFQERWGLRSLAITLAVFAVLELALGIGLYVRTAPQVARLMALFGSEPARFFAEEGARMARVQRTFAIVTFVEVVLIAASAVVALTQKGRFWISGIALGLLLNAAMLLAFDLIADRRGGVWLAALTDGQKAAATK
jgi:hypothetical protein